ncbi:hypothetical protein ASPACDRAFT_42444 [Aspergillus aculeatus ATCC 16872]|uniref:Uncharacterized protein n=1 Tax=Aspergillus aculeatus (strain ATCC 16872 / CBS 172.66 / WB 5094) TaxID=690307 RepID=A0A1L9WXQ3_ASPA1|nr:uncharacterized protein ASPACDRAFT_42444 [Aspergillus aculeatus ATCC 16872]OJK00944.1 hypothetical protein ASPACDRAFT_42444 [Aspergillus aculeatus ATCC 16872]
MLDALNSLLQSIQLAPHECRVKEYLEAATRERPSKSTQTSQPPFVLGLAWFGEDLDGKDVLASVAAYAAVLSTTFFRLYRAIRGNAIGDIIRQAGTSKYMLLYLILGGIATITITMPTPYQYVSAITAADNGTAFEKWAGTPAPGVMTEGPPPAVGVYMDDGRDEQYNYTLLSDNTLSI